MLIALTLLNYLGQRIIDHKEEVFESVYCKTNWYIMSPKLRRWVHIIAVASTDCSGLSAGKMGDISLEAAGIVIFL